MVGANRNNTVNERTGNDNHANSLTRYRREEGSCNLFSIVTLIPQEFPLNWRHSRC